jgi:hypothetical protein
MNEKIELFRALEVTELREDRDLRVLFSNPSYYSIQIRY